MPPTLSLHDIADLRAYERERDDFRIAIIAMSLPYDRGIAVSCPAPPAALSKGP